MYLVAKFGNGGNRDISSYIRSYMSTFEKAELTASVHHVDRISKSGILIYNSEVQTRMTEKKKKNNIKKDIKVFFSLKIVKTSVLKISTMRATLQ